MITDHWRAARDGYVLHHGDLGCKLAFRGATPGLRDVSPPIGDRQPLWPGPLMAVQSVQLAGRRAIRFGSTSVRPAHRVRTRVVDVQWDTSRRCPVRLQVYWSATSDRQLDLEVLATTLDPFERCEVLTLSRVPHAAVFVLAGADRDDPRWVEVMVGQSGTRLVLPRDREAAKLSLDGRAPCFGDMLLAGPYACPLVLYRPIGHDWSYVEMSSPDDCARIIACRTRNRAEVNFGLFGLDLEKGVILRGRVRGVFIARNQDTDRARDLYAEFAGESPHLSV